MGYLFLSISLVSGITKGYCGKKTSFAIVTNSDSIITNLLRMVACIIIGILLAVFQNGPSSLVPSEFMLLVAALSGVASAVFVVSWLLSVRSGAYMMVEVFLLLGVIVPIILCRIFFGEAIGVWQIIGTVVLLFAVSIMCTYNSSIKGRMSVRAFWLLLICGLSNGIADFSQKLFVKEMPEGFIATFNFYTYIFAAITLLLAYVVFRNADKKHGLMPRKPLEIVKPIWYYVLIMAVCLFANSFFKTQAAHYLDAVQLYPIPYKHYHKSQPHGYHYISFVTSMMIRIGR